MFCCDEYAIFYIEISILQILLQLWPTMSNSFRATHYPRIGSYIEIKGWSGKERKGGRERSILIRRPKTEDVK